jgi:uncharacterized membrane protein (UPF0127 family)
VGLAAIVVYFALADDRSSERVPRGTTEVRASRDPFPGLTEATIAVGEERLRVVIADDEGERYQGLREISDLGPYDGMLFIYDDVDTRSFTMSTVPVALQIGFYDERGRRVNSFRMEPCPSGIDCTSYPSEVPFRYALETFAGELPDGGLGVTPDQ